jgi:hypothetical protein
MKKLTFLFIVFILIISGLTIWQSTKNVNNYWNEQEEITCADSINITIEKTGYNRGYLSFNHKYYIFDANVVKSNLELWEATQLKRPFTINKSGSSDTLWLLTKDTNYFFVLEE